MLISKFNNDGIKQAINQFEKEIVKIPRQYKDFLIKYNGGRTPETTFKINKVSSDLVCFYGLGNTEEYYDYLKL